MVEAVDALAVGAGLGEPELVASGLQIEPGWLSEAGDRQRALLRRVERLGVRDPISLRAIEGLAATDGGPAAALTGDDAVGLVARTAPPPSSGKGVATAINLHYCEGEWVTDDRERLSRFVSGLVAGLARESGAPLEIQPVIAYEDARVSERPQLERLAEAVRCDGAARATAEPLVLRPDRLEVAARALGRAELTVSCSYHVALTSLLLGVPAVLVRGNGYYAQKAEGLRRDFELPDEFFPDAGDDPGAAAARISRSLTGGAPVAAVARARERVVGRRSAAEGEILARLADGVARAPRPPGDGRTPVPHEQFEEVVRGFERAAKRIGELHELAAWQEGRLRDITESASWRWTAALRRIKGAGRLRR
jgi:hypothetical protein